MIKAKRGRKGSYDICQDGTLVGLDPDATPRCSLLGPPIRKLGVGSRRMACYFRAAGLVLRSGADDSGVPAEADRQWAACVIQVGIDRCYPLR